MMRYPDECGKKWRIEKQTKLGWKKQKEQEEKKANDRRGKNDRKNNGRKGE